jgi:hypothetical protein
VKWWRAALGALGIGLMGFAVLGALGDRDIAPVPHLLFLAAVIAAHDGVVLPLAIGVGALVHRYVPGRVRGIVHGGLFVSVAIAVVALPLVLGFGRSADNASALPLDYPYGLLVALAAVWLGVAVLIAGRLLLARLIRR